MAAKPSRTLTAGFLAAAAALVFFGWLSSQVVGGATAEFDSAIRLAVHDWASPRLTYLMRGITELGAPRFLIPLALVLIWRLNATGRRRAAIIFTIAAIGGEALDQLLKLVFHRVRPEAFFGYTQPGSYSFPSGHSVVSACFYGVAAAVLAARMRSRLARALTWAAAALLSFAIGLSRVYLGVHHPSDVIAGFAAAIIWVGAVRAGYEVWRRRRVPRTAAPGEPVPTTDSTE